MMLERLLIRNFQRHGRLDVRLDEPIVTITGESDSGKSSVLRALRWLAFNRPRGDGFIRTGQNRCQVKLRIDGRTVRRDKGKGRNSYTIDGEVLKSFGADVPAAVSDVLRLGEQNFSGQHDPPFWFSLTPGEVAKRLNAIVDLGVIDEVMGRVASRQRWLRSETEVVEGRLARAVEEAERLEFVGDLDRELGELEEGTEETSRLRALCDRLAASVREGMEHREAGERLSGAALDGRVALDAGGEARRLEGEVSALDGLLRDAEEAREAADREVPDMEDLEESMDAAEAARGDAELLSDLIELIDVAKGVSAEWYNVLEREESRLKVELGSRCPLCGGEMRSLRELPTIKVRVTEEELVKGDEE